MVGIPLPPIPFNNFHKGGGKKRKVEKAVASLIFCLFKKAYSSGEGERGGSKN